MNLLYILLKYFYKEEKFNIILTIILNLLVNIFKINIISYVTSNIIKSIENNNLKYAYEYYEYLIVSFIFFIILFYFLSKYSNIILLKIKNWTRLFLLKTIYYNSNENLLKTNYTLLNAPIMKYGSAIHYLLNIFLNKIIPNISLILIIFIFFLYKNYKIALIFLVGNVIFLLYLYNNCNKLVNSFNIFEKQIVNNENSLSENLNNFNKIIIRGKKNNEINNFNNNINYLNKLGNNFNNLINNILLNSNIILNGLVLIIIGYLIYSYYNKQISNVIFITFITVLLLYRDLILILIDEIPFLIECISRGNNIEINFNKKLFSNLLNNINIKHDIKLKKELEFNNIEFNNIYFKYESESKKIFDNLNLKINIENKIIGLTGLSGNGKSTIIKLLLKLYPYEGNILIDNINVKDINTEYLRQNIVYVDQSANLFDKKIIENINYGINNENDIILSKNYFNEIMQYSTIKQLYSDIDFESKNAGFNG
jgi:ABC-type multidrug transport system fused ATPase/permease subunit